MRILYFTSSYPPYASGVAVFTARCVVAMREAGQTVAVASPALDTPPQVRQNNGVTEYHLRSLPNPFRKHHRFAWVTPGEIKNIITQFQPDIIHYNDPSLWPAQIAPWARAQGIKLVFTQHALTNYATVAFPPLKLLTPLVVNFWHNILKQFDLITAPSRPAMHDVAVTLGTVPVPLIQISNGVDQTLFKPRPRHHAAEKTLRFLYVGRLDTEKGIGVLLEALAQLVGDWHLTLVGTGKCEPELRAQVAAADLTEKITFAGQQPEKKLPDYYHAADVFVIPSFSETQSIVTLQALACGLPVVASDCTAFPEIVLPGKNGWLFAVGDPVALRQCLAECMVDRERLRRYGIQSTRVAAPHGLKQVNALWLQTYRKLLEHQL